MVADDRKQPQYPTSTVCKSAFLMASCQLGSLNELEQCNSLPIWQKLYNLKKLPSADTMGDVAAKLSIKHLRIIQKVIYMKLKRNKALLSDFHDNLCFLVIDGHECCSSYLRTCDECLQRELQTNNGPRTQYYHRYAMGMLINGNGINIPLDIEMQKPGEDEVACAERLIERLCKMYPRAFDVILTDGLYARAPFFHKVVSLKKDVITVLKDDRRDLVKEVRKQCDNFTPETFNRNGVSILAWDFEGCTGWSQLESTVRVVRTIESSTVKRKKTGVTVEKQSEWLWATTIPKNHLITQRLVNVAHHRWDVENQGFNELKTYWHIDHIYKHDTNAILVFCLMAMLAYTLFHAFLLLNLKPALRKKCSKKHIQKLITAEFYTRGAEP